jgi:2-epi-5-epi-valiolone synthase
MAVSSNCPLIHTVAADREGSFAIQLCKDGTDDLVQLLSDAIGDRKAMIVSTPKVAELYAREITDQLVGTGHNAWLFVRPFDEGSKQLPAVEDICKEYYRLLLDRKSVLISIGGGVCSDLVTVAASWIRRGISHIRVPTTLIGQIDAAIGIKGAVNFGKKKSALGAFYPPEYVLVQPSFLRTVPRDHLRAGLAEIVKIALVADAKLFHLLAEHGRELLDSSFAAKKHVAMDLLWRAAIRMIEQLQPNLYENRSLQRLVDFGHTFSPAVEGHSEYAILHGEAVAIDIALSSVLAKNLSLLDEADCATILKLLRELELPINCDVLDYPLAVASLEDARRHRGGRVNLVVPVQIGQGAFIEDIETITGVLESSLSAIRQQVRGHAA